MKLPAWLRTLGKWLAMAAGAAALLFVVRKPVADLVARAVAWISPDRKRGWRRVHGDPTHVDVIQPEGNAVRVKLPDGVVVDDVQAIGVSQGGYSIEVVHTARDRRAPGG